MADRLGNYLLLPHTQTELRCSLMHGKASSLDLNGDAVWLVTDLGQIWAAFKNLYYISTILNCLAPGRSTLESGSLGFIW